MRRFYQQLLSLILGAGATLSHADAAWEIKKIEETETVSRDVTRYRVDLVESQSGVSATLHLAVFEASKVKVEVVDQPSEPRSKSAAIFPKTNVIAAINAGYFHPDYRPAGLLVAQGREINGFERAKLLSGVVAATAERFFILRTNEFKQGPKTLNALQSGPFLVDKGAVVTGLNDVKRARRSLVATDGRNRNALVFTTGLSLRETGELLASGVLDPVLKIKRALNLDGGSSSGFWARNADGSAFSMSEIKTVRNFLVLKPR